MSTEMQPSPVVFFPPALDPRQRINNMDFRPIPAPVEAVEQEEDADPKDLSAQESAPSSAKEPSQPSTPSLPQAPAMIAPAAKDSGKRKENEPSTQTS